MFPCLNYTPTASTLSLGSPLTNNRISAQPQYEYFWRDSNNNLTGRNWNKPLPQQATGLEDSINNSPLSMSPTSSVAAYWPYIATQDGSATTGGGSSNMLRVTTYIGGEGWVNATISAAAAPGVAVASEGTALAIVPIAATYKQPWEAGLVYRADDGRLAGVSLLSGKNITWKPWSIGTFCFP